MTVKKVFSLSQLTLSVQKMVNTHCSKDVWIKAEIVKLNYYPKSGHCYPTLVEKSGGKVIAEMRGNIWGDRFQEINKKFKEVLKEELKDEITVVIRGSVSFNPVHGLAFNIVDIDPEYTLGELAREKAETIFKLKEEEIFDNNKNTILPKLPKTIAVISVETSKGYLDFLSVIENNTWGYKFHHLLFPAILQGERAVSTINQQLERIREFSYVFDAVAIIRGGGGEIGLSCFDNYHLAKKIATFPIPVLTGIGHSTNITVSELVSYQSFITPTKIGEFLLQKFQEFALPLKLNAGKITNETTWLFKNHKNALQETSRLFNSISQRSLEKNKYLLEEIFNKLSIGSKEIVKTGKEQIKGSAGKINSFVSYSLNDYIREVAYLQLQIESLSQSLLEKEVYKVQISKEKVRLLSPENILKRGYSITRQNGKTIRDLNQLDNETLIETQLFNGFILSQIINKKKS